MSLATSADNGRFSGIEARRSTRLERAIPLIIMGIDKRGELSQETTSAVSLNLQLLLLEGRSRDRDRRVIGD